MKIACKGLVSVWELCSAMRIQSGRGSLTVSIGWDIGSQQGSEASRERLGNAKR
jgi:hypothetical protein